MNPFRGKGWACVLVILGLILPPPGGGKPALASGPAEKETAWIISGTAIGLLSCAAIYAMWRNRPSQQGKEGPKIFPGEFYAGGYLGASLVQSTNLHFNRFPLAPGTDLSASSQKFEPSVVGGVKLGYFLQQIPYLGLEADSSWTRNYSRNQQITLSQPVQGTNKAFMATASLMNWTLGLHIVGRYGFLPDQEVPFGRLQPYVGVGPAMVVLWDEHDTAINLAVDVMAGVRYMVLKNVSAFLEYKFTHQWDVELENRHIYPLGSTGAPVSNVAFDYTSHRIVLGVAYHF